MLGAIAALTIASRTPSSSAPPTSVSSGTSPISAPPVQPSTPTTATATTPAPTGGLLLGRDLAANNNEACRSPAFAGGSAWVPSAVTLKGKRYENAYYCNVYSGAIGSLDFVLPAPAQQLTVTVGILEDSGALRHRIKFEIVGDGRFVLDERTLAFGEVAELRADLTGRSRLQLKISEVGPAGENSSPSRPVWAGPTLT